MSKREGPESCCKCGQERPGWEGWEVAYNDHTKSLQFKCRRCGYTWNEDPADKHATIEINYKELNQLKKG